MTQKGTCPLCGFLDARGDQCDGCGHLLNAVELVNPVCRFEKDCGNKPQVKSTQHLFLDLPKVNERLSAWIDEASKKGEWSQVQTLIFFFQTIIRIQFKLPMHG